MTEERHSTPATVGDLFQHYEVVERVGEGGMGVVYRARDTKLGRDVALKFMLDAVGLDSHLAGRLRREARALAALNHPNILTIHDIGDADGTPFLVLEWVGGGALADASYPLPLSTQDFIRVALGVADALAAAHEEGIVHRDVKPANVLIGEEGRVKLADFGLAKLRRPDQEMTRTAGAIGTVAYMSPEQANAGEVGPPSDIFSFGVLAYELLSGQRPFAGDSPGAVIGAILAARHTSLSQVRQDLSPKLVAVVERCLAKAPGERFQDGRELAHALRRALSPSGLPATVIEAAFEPPRLVAPTHEQDIRFCTTSDGVCIAYSAIGQGPLLVRVLGHFTHLEMEWEWPDLRRMWERLAERYTVVRYDGRGIGLSDPWADVFTEETRQLDLEAVLKAMGAERAILFGISEGGWSAATHALEHPDRVSHLVLYGAYRRGARARPGYDAEEDQALMTLMRKGWGRDTPAFRQIFTSRFFPSDADPGLLAHFNELQRLSADPDTAARYHEACHQRGDGRDLFSRVRTPTLVLHCREDLAVSKDEGRLLASTIPDAQLVLLPNSGHYFPTHADVVERIAGAIDRFLTASAERSAVDDLVAGDG